MKKTNIRLTWILLSFPFLLALGNTASAQIQYHTSSLGRYQIYATTWYNSQGAAVGLQVHYSLGALQDTMGLPSHYAAVCVKNGAYFAPCIEQASKVWTRETSYYAIGTWVTQNIPLNCSDPFTTGFIQVHQPYVQSGSLLNFPRNNQSPYQGSQLFYSGSSDSANLQIQGCRQLYW